MKSSLIPYRVNKQLILWGLDKCVCNLNRKFCVKSHSNYHFGTLTKITLQINNLFCNTSMLKWLTTLSMCDQWITILHLTMIVKEKQPKVKCDPLFSWLVLNLNCRIYIVCIWIKCRFMYIAHIYMMKNSIIEYVFKIHLTVLIHINVKYN